jgi:hypothetical protein
LLPLLWLGHGGPSRRSIYGSISVSLERPEVGIQHESRMRLHVDLLFA